ncbi:hypothetical protein R3P38DRAFT_3263069 [Favolaschia claudopus]|uniref:Uncharacterized protein n=1 Tax=Favolaschia claudopus TaxID=2862362 RepID=A0AAW0CDI8_9AGAR
MPKCREVTSELHIRSTYTADDLARPLPPTTTTTSPGLTPTPSPSLSSRTTTLAVVVVVAVAFLHSFNVTVNDPRTLAAPLPSTRLHHPTGHIHLFPARRRGFFSRKCPATRAEIYWSKTEVGEKIKTATPLLFASPLSLSKLYEQVSERRSRGSPPVNWRSCSRTGVPSRAVFTRR